MSSASVAGLPTVGRVYFRGFDAVRGLAALAVAACHIEQHLALAGRPTLWYWAWVPGLASAMVSLFFVLSGFLITALLLTERAALGTVAVGQFYVRRALRIWPLYFVVILWALFALPFLAPVPAGFASLHPAPWPIVVLFLTFLPNVAYALYPFVLGAAQAWSIGVEEQFYAVWPWVVRRFGDRLWGVCLLLVVARILLSAHVFGQSLIVAGQFQDNVTALLLLDLLPRVLATVKLTHFAAGALAARFVLAGGDLRRLASRPALALCILVLAGLPVLPAVGSAFPGRRLLLDEPFEAVFLALILLHLAGNRSLQAACERPLFAWLGRISYGVYMLHISVIALVQVLLDALATNAWSVATYRFVLTVTVLVGTLSLATASYALLERPFLRLKERFARVPSGQPV